MKTILGIIIAIFLFGYLAADQFNIEIKASSYELPLSDDVTLNISLDHPDNFAPDLQGIRGDLLRQRANAPSPFTYVGEKISEEGLKTLYQITLSPQIVGHVTLTIPSVKFTSAKGEPVAIPGKSITLEITSIDGQSTPLELIAPLMPIVKRVGSEISFANQHDFIDNTKIDEEAAKHNVTLFNQKQIPWLYIFTALVMIVLIYSVRANPKNASYTFGLMEKVDPREKALKELGILELSLAKNAPGDQISKKLIYDVDALVRTYLKETTPIDATSATTAEFTAKSALAADQKIMAEFTVLLEQADQLKYAASEPTKADFASLTNSAAKLCNK